MAQIAVNIKPVQPIVHEIESVSLTLTQDEFRLITACIGAAVPYKMQEVTGIYDSPNVTNLYYEFIDVCETHKLRYRKESTWL